MIAYPRGFTVRDLAVGLTCLLGAASLLIPLSGATRNLSQTQVCASNLRQLGAGLTAYVTQYGFYPPHNPYPQYMASQTIGGMSTNGFDPNIGFIMTYGLGLNRRIWFGIDFDSLPDVCKCPSLPPSLMTLNPETDANALESFVAEYALSYQTSGTCRAPTRLIPQSGGGTAMGGRNPPIPDPTRALESAHPNDNAQNGVPYVYTTQHTGAPSDNPTGNPEYSCWIQAISPSEVQLPSRVYYLADSRDYRPVPGGYPRAGYNSGWISTWGNYLLMGTRHFEYPNVLYLDGRVSRDNLTHYTVWNLSPYPEGDTGGVHYRSSSFSTNIRLANVSTQSAIMPVLMVRGWEYFFEANGVAAR